MTELQYIYNTSNARFTIPVTDMTSIKKVEFKLSYQNVSPSTNQNHIFKLGGDYGDFVLRKFQGQFDIYWYNITGIVPNPQPVTDEIITCTYDIANSVCTWNGTDYPLSGTQQYASDTTIYIGGNNWLLTVCYFKMWDASDNLLHHFVGCDNNGTVGIDDKVTGDFYAPTTGVFLAGPQLKIQTDLTIGNKTVVSINIGGKDVVSIYDGTTLLWKRKVTPQPTPPSLSDCVCFEALDANTSIRLHASQDYSFFTVNLWYSTDGGTTFSKMDRLTPITLPNIGDKMYVYGSNVSLGQSNLNYVRFLIYDGDVSVSGDLTRLLNPNGLTALPDYAFVKTFSNNTHLADVSGLTIPVTTVGKSSLAGLFEGCSNITTSPTLQATTLGEGCYENMFYGCTNLNRITCLATDISATNCTTNWVSGVAANGTFIKTCYMTSWTTGVSGIPSGWTVLDNDVCTVDCTNYSDMGYASYEDCDCSENGNSNGYHYVIHNYTSGCSGWTVTYDGSQDCDAINHQQAGLWFEWELSYSPPTTYQQYVDGMSSYGITVNGSYCPNAHYSVWLEAVQD